MLPVMKVLTIFLLTISAIITPVNAEVSATIPGVGATITTVPPSMADVEVYLKSIGVTIGDVCGYHHQTLPHRDLTADGLDENNAIEEKKEKTREEYINSLLAFLCVTVAALAAGLTMGLLSQELLDLRIKEIASADPQTREQAKSLVPLIKDHHRLVSFECLCYYILYCTLIF